MKYIMIEQTFKDGSKVLHPIIFPKSGVHKDMSESSIKSMEKMWPGTTFKTIFAGNCRITFGIETHGESTTLGLKSREVDAQIIKTLDTTHGMVDNMWFLEEN